MGSYKTDSDLSAATGWMGCDRVGRGGLSDQSTTAACILSTMGKRQKCLSATSQSSLPFQIYQDKPMSSLQLASPLVSWGARCAPCGRAPCCWTPALLLVKWRETDPYWVFGCRTSWSTECKQKEDDWIHLSSESRFSGVTCVVALPLVQREDGSGWGKEGKRTGLEERQPRQLKWSVSEIRCHFQREVYTVKSDSSCLAFADQNS